MPDIFELTFLPLLIHLFSTPHQFSTLFKGQWGSKGPKEIKIRVTKTSLPKYLGIDSQIGAALQARAKNRTKETKPHLLGQALLPFSETPFRNAVLVPPTPCLHLVEPGGCRRCCTAAGTCGCSSLASTPTHLGCLTVCSFSSPSSQAACSPQHIALCCFAPQRMSSVTNDNTVRFSGK